MFILFAFKSITGNTPLELAAPGRKTQTSDYHINKLWHFAAKLNTIYIFLTLLRPIFRFFCLSKNKGINLKELIMSPKSHSKDTRTSLVTLL